MTIDGMAAYANAQQKIPFALLWTEFAVNVTMSKRMISAGLNGVT
jgi:hypothetical protein